MSLGQMAMVIGKVFECDPWDLRLARLDLAVDVPGIPVRWFRNHLCVPRTRQIKVIGIEEDAQDGGGGTMYLGGGADLVRLYDKEAELRSKSCRPAETERLALTRIEHQLRSGRIPRELTHLGALMNNAAHFNPFASVILLPGGKPRPSPQDYPLRRHGKRRAQLRRTAPATSETGPSDPRRDLCSMPNKT